MSGNAKLRWFLLAPLLVALFVVVSSPVISWAGKLEDALERVRQNPNDADAHNNLGISYGELGQYQKAIDSFREAIRIKPDLAKAHHGLGFVYKKNGQHYKAIASYKKAIQLEPTNAGAHYYLGISYGELGQYQKAIDSFREAIRIKPDLAKAHHGLGFVYKKNGQHYKAIASYKKAIQLEPTNKDVILKSINELEQIVVETRPSPSSNPPQAQEEQLVSKGTGFLFSEKDYVITNYHVIKRAGAILAQFTNGKIVEAKIVAKDLRSDIAVLKLEGASFPSVTQIKLGDSSQARIGEKVFTIGYPASKIMGERPKYSEGVINALTGLKDDPAFFQVSVPVQPGNSGGPLFNQQGEVIGITTASLSPLAMDTMGTMPQNVNYAIKSSFIKNLLSTVPELMLSNTGIVVVSNEFEKSLLNFIEQVSKNIVLIKTKK